MKKILTVQQVQRALARLYEAIAEAMPEVGRVAIIGIRTRGETLAGRIVDRLRAEKKDLDIEHGVLDITFYRDDLSRRRGAPLVRATEIDFDIDDTFVVLVDDVVHTGRSVRAALDALHDFGRPKVIRLAVLIDRGGRELPIAPDLVGRKVSAPNTKRVQVRLKENDGEEGVFLINSF
ncbi:MAG TPA: bifunctional pyr operon transcriptional regulator/uracil phosphoribosyltransferase PyrR [Phycisphaerae bacterium]|nr:bifunctional pyr operon transcriptional regulator/uracil phosphoribosyltransferase PyrR [Phycisphaerae bacterium]